MDSIEMFLSKLNQKHSAVRTETPNDDDNNGSTITNKDINVPIEMEFLVENHCSSSGINILDLPVELLYKIFKYLPFEIIGKKRLVCKQFNKVCSDILNSEFQTLRNYTQQLFKTIKAQMPRRESARRKHLLAHEYDIIETLNMRLTLLQMCFFKHIKNSHCCFFAGEILDEVHRILLYLRQTPVLGRAYKVTDELFDLSTMAMEYFKEYVEPTLPDINYIGVNDYIFDPFVNSSTSFSNESSSVSCSSSSPSSSLSSSNNNSFNNSPNGECSYSPSINHQSNNDIPEHKSLSPSYDLTDTTDTKLYSSLSPLLHTNISSDSYQKHKTYSLTRLTLKRVKRLEYYNRRYRTLFNSMRSHILSHKTKIYQQKKLLRKYRIQAKEYDYKLETLGLKLNEVLEELSKCTTELQHIRAESKELFSNSNFHISHFDINSDSLISSAANENSSQLTNDCSLLTPSSTPAASKTETSNSNENKFNLSKRKLSFDDECPNSKKSN